MSLSTKGQTHSFARESSKTAVFFHRSATTIRMARAKCSRAGALVALALLLALTPIVLALEPTLFEDFAKGWEKRWAYSKDKAKYAGRFISVQPPGYKDPAIQVCLVVVVVALVLCGRACACLAS